MPPACSRRKSLWERASNRKELSSVLAVKQPLAILRKGRSMPDRVIHRQSDEPAEQGIVVELLNEHPLAANTVEYLQQESPQEPLRRNRGSLILGIQPRKLRRRLAQDRVHDRGSSFAADDLAGPARHPKRSSTYVVDAFLSSARRYDTKKSEDRRWRGASFSTLLEARRA
jgi:hypothetical protein